MIYVLSIDVADNFRFSFSMLSVDCAMCYDKREIKCHGQSQRRWRKQAVNINKEQTKTYPPNNRSKYKNIDNKRKKERTKEKTMEHLCVFYICHWHIRLHIECWRKKKRTKLLHENENNHTISTTSTIFIDNLFVCVLACRSFRIIKPSEYFCYSIFITQLFSILYVLRPRACVCVRVFICGFDIVDNNQ